MRTSAFVLVLALAQIGGLPVPEGTPWSFDCTDHAALLNAEHHTLRVYRNEVFARHGRTFKSKDLQEHFGKQDWYTPDPSYADSRLTAADTACVARIAAFEKSDYTMWAAEVDLGPLGTTTDVTLLANDPRLMGKVRSTDPEVLGCSPDNGGPCKATLLIDAVAVPLELNWRVVFPPSAPVKEVGLSSEEWWHAGVYLVDIDASDGKKELVLRNARYGMVDPEFTYAVLDRNGVIGAVAADHVHTLAFPGEGGFRLDETTCIFTTESQGWGTQQTVFRARGTTYEAGPVKVLKIESPYCAG